MTVVKVDVDELIVVHCLSGEKLIGLCELSDDEINYRVENQKAIPLKDVRKLIQQMNVLQTGQVQQFAAILPMDICEGPMDYGYAVAGFWYHANVNEAVKKKFADLLDAAYTTEAEMHARNRGVAVPSDGIPQMPGMPGGRHS